MYLVAIAWIYVVLMMALSEAMSSQGTVLGALFTLLIYGVLPLGVVLYIMGTPLRRRRIQRLESEAAAASGPAASASVATQADAGGHAPGAAVPPVGKEG
ncbi:MAG: hypothetical protein ACOVOG_02320 [Rubrivivax sp.]|jgi:hypothetical protein|nr:hypothetical protein [Rubrivivax sp.]